ncbi:MAG: hypothetical protein IM620_21510 [Cytophagales bacterium]|nr:hypothetical protein [Cytophagales bacterium]
MTVNEKTLRVDWGYRSNIAYTFATSTATAGIDLSYHNGAYGVPNAYPGTSLSYISCNESAGNGTQIFGIPHGGNVSTNKKHIINASVVSPPTLLNPVGAGFMVLVDLQGYWANINFNTTSVQNLTGTPGSTLRYTNGEGCRLYLVSTATSNATTSAFTITFNNTSGTTRTANVAKSTSCSNGQINHLNAGGFNNSSDGIFIPLHSNDTGVSNCQSIQLTTATTGTAALCLARPLIYMPFPLSTATMVEKNFVFQIPTLPRVMDGACLTWLFHSGWTSTSPTVSANCNFHGHLDFAWG